MSTLTPADLDRLSERKNGVFDGLAAVTNKELDALIEGCREALTLRKRLNELAADWSQYGGQEREAAQELLSVLKGNEP